MLLRRPPSMRRTNTVAVAAASAAALALTALHLRRRQRRLAAARPTAVELLAEVGKRSKAVLYIVSNKTNDAFSLPNLTKYLKHKGIEPCERTSTEEATLANAQALLDLLERTGNDSARPTRSPPLRHSLQKGGISPERLQALFPKILDAYVQQPLDYGRGSRYSDKWKISCYLVVMEHWKPKIFPHAPMVECMAPVMSDCVDAFVKWYTDLKALESVEASVMNAFVTRYRPMPDEDQLEKHIDGANVDGSVVMAMPTDDPWEGGALHVWDGKPQKEHIYHMGPGDILFLDNAVWHQAKPISSGTRWALVLFLRLNNAVPKEPSAKPEPAAAMPAAAVAAKLAEAGAR